MENRALHPAKIVLFLMLALMLAVAPEHSLAKEKYAALVIDGNSGKVLHADNASDIRHPASLTKLMTIYMTFDALRTGKLKMGTVLKASKKAASMPSTNIRMKRGDRITVRDAIKALVVRSANDVAVVLGEKLAGSEYKFAKRMTATARRLGMKRTVFKNASGLPNRQQVTTARDMAVLAMALRRHYPQHYHFFRTTKFKYKGKLYSSHNKAMARISGADGLKTGYIRASGFNLITSAKRRDKSVIGVVMGGQTSKSRDDRMVTLVERTFARMNLNRNRRQFVLNDDPIPQAKPQELVLLAQRMKQPEPKRVVVAEALKAETQPQQQSVATSTSSAKAKQYAALKPAANAKQRQYVSVDFGGDAKKVVQFTPPAPAAVTRPTPYDVEMDHYQKSRGQFMPVAYQTDSATKEGYQVKPTQNWGVQVGAYEDPREALVAASNAASRLVSVVKAARIHVQDKQKVQGKLLHRARLADMTEKQAKRACEKLEAMNTPCFVYHQRKSDI